MVPRLIQLLDLITMPNIQYEAAWCLTNIATGTREQVQCLTEKGAVPRLIVLMNSEHDNLKEQVRLFLPFFIFETFCDQNHHRQFGR